KIDHTPEEITKLEDYCLDDDCASTLRLFFKMLPYLDLLRAPINGAFMMGIERIRWRGKPVDVVRYQEAKRYTPVILPKMREDLNRKLGARSLFCRRVQTSHDAATYAATQHSHPDRSQDGERELRHQVNQAHDRDVSVVERLLRRQTDDRCNQKSETRNRFGRSKSVLAQSVWDQDGTKQPIHQ